MPSQPKNSIARALAFVLLAVAGCGSDPTGSPAQRPTGGGAPEPTGDVMRAGGQTGMEGGCMGRAEAVPAYTREDVLALVVGHHETTLAHRDLWQTVDADLENEPGTPLSVDVVAVAESEVDGESDGNLECPREESARDWVEVEVHLRGGDPPVEVVFRERAVALQLAGTTSTLEAVVLHAQLAPEVAERLVAAFEPRPELFDARQSSLLMYFGSGGFRGQISSGTGCGALVFPAGTRCAEEGSREYEPDAKVREGLDWLAELRELPVQWPDGSLTTFSVELLGEPLQICGLLATHALDPDRLDVSLRIWLSSDDRRVQLTLPAHLRRDPDPGTFDPWDLFADALVPQSALSSRERLEFAISGEDLALVNLRIMRDSQGVARTMLDVASIAREPDAQVVDGLIDLWAEGKERACFGTRTEIATATTPRLTP